MSADERGLSPGYLVGESGNRLALPLPGELRAVQIRNTWYCSGCGAIVAPGLNFGSHVLDPPHTRWIARFDAPATLPPFGSDW